MNTVPYGYKADPADKHHLIIDAETAPIVRRIFMDVISGKSCTQIAKELNTEGIPTPAQHKAVSRKASSKKPQWTHRGLLTMIESVKYTGTMVNHTRESRFIRDRNQRRVPKEKWYIRENVHEAIVTKDEYEQAQEAIQRRRKFVRSSMISQTEFTSAHTAVENLRKPMEPYLPVRPIGITMAVRAKTSAGGKAHLKKSSLKH